MIAGLKSLDHSQQKKGEQTPTFFIVLNLVPKA
jgi:hypothetical protein